MTSFEMLTGALEREQVEYVIVGGAAASAHGSPRFTQDLDIVYRRSPENIARMVRALAPFSPYPRGAPPNLPFIWDNRTLQSGLNFTLVTSVGCIDLLGEIAGGGVYEELKPHSIETDFFGRKCHALGISKPYRDEACRGPAQRHGSPGRAASDSTGTRTLRLTNPPAETQSHPPTPAYSDSSPNPPASATDSKTVFPECLIAVS